LKPEQHAGSFDIDCRYAHVNSASKRWNAVIGSRRPARRTGLTDCEAIGDCEQIHETVNRK
jgi:hypothetical protein